MNQISFNLQIYNINMDSKTAWRNAINLSHDCFGPHKRQYHNLQEKSRLCFYPFGMMSIFNETTAKAEPHRRLRPNMQVYQIGEEHKDAINDAIIFPLWIDPLWADKYGHRGTQVSSRVIYKNITYNTVPKVYIFDDSVFIANILYIIVHHRKICKCLFDHYFLNHTESHCLQISPQRNWQFFISAGKQFFLYDCLVSPSWYLSFPM